MLDMVATTRRRLAAPTVRHLYHVGEWRFISPWGLLPEYSNFLSLDSNSAWVFETLIFDVDKNKFTTMNRR
jgi:hypothetical protein